MNEFGIILLSVTPAPSSLTLPWALHELPPTLCISKLPCQPRPSHWPCHSRRCSSPIPVRSASVINLRPSVPEFHNYFSFSACILPSRLSHLPLDYCQPTTSSANISLYLSINTPVVAASLRPLRKLGPSFATQLQPRSTARFLSSTRHNHFTQTNANMVVHNLAEYVAYHQQKLRDQASSSSASTTPQPKKKPTIDTLRSKQSYIEAVVNASADKLIVLDMFATWCGPCKAIAPTLVQYSEEFSNASFYKIDVDETPDVAQELGVRAMPTFLLFKGGEKVAEIVGADKNTLKRAIEKNL